MSTPNRYTLPKLERLNSRILIEKLFAGGSKSFPAFPFGEAGSKEEEDKLWQRKSAQCPITGTRKWRFWGA